MRGWRSSRARAAAEHSAASWYARLHGDSVSDDERVQFEDWRERSDANAAAWRRLAAMDQRLEQVRGTAEIRQMRQQPHRQRTSLAPRHFGALAAALIVGAIGGAILVPRIADPRTAAERPAGIFYRTAVGEQRAVTLSDGSEMIVDTDSMVHVPAWDARRTVRVERGRAFFRVAHDPARPFVVSALGNAVTALGTRFAVAVDGDRFDVKLVEGAVQVEVPAARRTERLRAGEMLEVRGARVSLATGDMAAATGWHSGRLIFDATPLGAASAEMNRYAQRKLRLASPELAARPVSGTFRAGDVAAFAAALQATGTARIVAADDGQIVLARG